MTHKIHLNTFLDKVNSPTGLRVWDCVRLCESVSDMVICSSGASRGLSQLPIFHPLPCRLHTQLSAEFWEVLGRPCDRSNDDDAELCGLVSAEPPLDQCWENQRDGVDLCRHMPGLPSPVNGQGTDIETLESPHRRTRVFT